MGTEIKIDEYTTNGQDSWHPRTGPDTLGTPADGGEG